MGSGEGALCVSSLGWCTCGLVGANTWKEKHHSASVASPCDTIALINRGLSSGRVGRAVSVNPARLPLRQPTRAMMLAVTLLQPERTPPAW